MLNITADILPRVMQCNGSLLMPDTVVAEETDEVRAEGIAVHWMIEQFYKTGQMPETFVERKAPNGVVISGEMADNLDDFLRERHANDKAEVEGEIGDGSSWRVGCRADRQRVIEDTLYTDEFKYGFTLVEVEMNWTLLAHAFRYVQTTRAPYPTHYTFTVYQPRAFHPKGKVRRWTITYDELATHYATLQATLSNPAATLTSGPKCRNCPKRIGCPAATAAGMNAVDISTRAYSDTISNEGLSEILDTMSRAEKVIKETKKAYESLAKHRLKSGGVVRNYSLERETTNLKWHDWVTPELALALTGLDVSKKALITPTQAGKMGANPEIMKTLADRFETGHKLTRVDDSEKAKKLFNQPKGN